MSKQMINRKSWEEFRSTGLLLFVNSFLHIFGWAIVFEIPVDGRDPIIYPARVRFRGFSEDQVSEDYIKLTKYMANNANELLEEAEE